MLRLSLNRSFGAEEGGLINLHTFSTQARFFDAKVFRNLGTCPVEFKEFPGLKYPKFLRNFRVRNSPAVAGSNSPRCPPPAETKITQAAFLKSQFVRKRQSHQLLRCVQKFLFWHDGEWVRALLVKLKHLYYTNFVY